jgi:hypothetical protein
MRITCPRCCGLWYMDLEPESGLPYTCFRCGNTGTVEAPHGACHDCGQELMEGEAEACGGTCEGCQRDRALWGQRLATQAEEGERC